MVFLDTMIQSGSEIQMIHVDGLLFGIVVDLTLYMTK